MRVPASMSALVLPLSGTLIVAALAAGCGQQSTHTAKPTDKATTECRGEWQALADSLAGRDTGSFASDLGERWNSVIATAQYYAASGKTSDCDQTLGDMNESVAAIEDLSTKLRPYDVAYAMGGLVASGTDYLASPLPKARDLKGKVVEPPSKQQVALALKILKVSARASLTDMQDGWDEANSVDLTNAAARSKVVNDVQFLASDSTPFQRSAAALTVLRRADAFSS